MRVSMLRVAVLAAFCLSDIPGPLLAQQAATPEAARLQALESAVRTLTDENTRLRQGAAAPAPANDSSAARSGDLDRQLAQAQAQRTAAEQRLAQAEQQRQAAEQQVAGAREERAVLQRQLTQAEEERQAAAGRLAAAQDEVRRLTAERDTAVAEAARQTEALAVARSEVRRAGEQAAGAMAQAERAATEAAAARESLAAAERRAEELGRELSARDGQVAGLRGELLAARNDLGAADGQLATKTKEAEALAGAGREAVAGQETAEAEVRSLRGQLAAAVEDAGRQRAEALAARNDLEAVEGRLQTQTREAESLAAEGRELLAAQERAEAEATALRERLARAEAATARPPERVSVAARTGPDEAAALTEPAGNPPPPRELVDAVQEALGSTGSAEAAGQRLVLPIDFNFRPASAVLPSPARAKVVAIGRSLAAVTRALPPATPWVLQVEGHSDRTPTGGRVFKNNRALSTARAVSVLDALAEGGLPMERLAAVGYGATRPIDSADNAEAYRRNRRIELRVTQD